MVNIFDSHVHLYPEPNLDKELNISSEPVNELLNNLSYKISQKNITQALVYLLDNKILEKRLEIPHNLIISSIVDVHNNYLMDLEKANNKKIKIIKVLPYDQEISRDEYSNILEIAEFIEDKKMVMTICSTYGSKLVYDTNGIELAIFLKKKTDIPIILAHGGGPKIFDAMSIAMDYENIFLDLSFSLKFWWGSTVIKDYAFSLKKLGCKKIFYGSDFPYVSFDDSINTFYNFVEKYSFNEEEINDLLYFNFKKFKNDYL